MSTSTASAAAPVPGTPTIEPVTLTPALLGESPFWHPREQRLYYLDIPGHALFRWSEGAQAPERWDLNSEPGCIVPLESGGLLVAQRNGLWRMDPDRGEYVQLAQAPYDASKRRFNDGKADAQGRLWVGTIDDARQPESALYCYRQGRFEVVQDGITSSNGLAWSPDGTTMYWADTKAHEVYQLDFDQKTGTVGDRRPFLKFPVRAEGQPLSTYGGRPDGAAVDEEGCYWIAMMEGQQLHRFSPSGECLQTVELPVRCATMPAFGGADLRTLFVTTAREKRSPEELAAQPLAGCVLRFRVPVAGLPVQYARLE